MTIEKTSHNKPDRMDWAFVGLIAHRPACPDRDGLDCADAAVLGVSIDTISS